jgi:hypothetical protein
VGDDVVDDGNAGANGVSAPSDPPALRSEMRWTGTLKS